MALLFRALSDHTRLRLINLLSGGEVCVCFFVEVIGTNQPKISRHLAYLRKAAVVRSRRTGKWIYYRLAEPRHARFARLMQEIVAQLAEDPQMSEDRRRLQMRQLASNTTLINLPAVGRQDVKPAASDVPDPAPNRVCPPTHPGSTSLDARLKTSDARLKT